MHRRYTLTQFSRSIAVATSAPFHTPKPLTMASRGRAEIDPLNLGFDPTELKKRYQQERDKRLRKEGARQVSCSAGCGRQARKFRRCFPPLFILYLIT